MSRRRKTGALVGLLLSTVGSTASAQRGESTAISLPAAPTRVAPFAAFSASASSLRDSVVALTRAQVGQRYVLGGQTPERGFDCSGLVKYVMAALAVDVPRTASQQARVGREVPRDTTRLRPGDLLTFGRGTRISHIGIYIGDGRYVHASSKAGRVIESPIVRPASRLIKPWRGVRRLLARQDSTADGPG